jgi:hypothetical protein
MQLHIVCLFFVLKFGFYRAPRTYTQWDLPTATTRANLPFARAVSANFFAPVLVVEQATCVYFLPLKTFVLVAVAVLFLRAGLFLRVPVFRLIVAIFCKI